MKIGEIEALASSCPRGGGSECPGCRSMCASGYPGRFTPDEASRAIDAGHAEQLILVSWKGTSLLRPAIVGWGGGVVAETTLAAGRCEFLTVTGRCEIHESGFKPIECRTAPCDRPAGRVTDRIVSAIERAWRTKRGRAVLERWRASVTPFRRRTEGRTGLMCSCVNVAIGSHANAIAVPIPPHMKTYRRARIAAGLSPLIGLDCCIAEEVQYLWSLGIVTYGSCCGHNKAEGSIVVAPDDHQKMLDLGYQKSADGPWFVARGVATDSAEGMRG